MRRALLPVLAAAALLVPLAALSEEQPVPPKDDGRSCCRDLAIDVGERECLGGAITSPTWPTAVAPPERSGGAFLSKL